LRYPPRLVCRVVLVPCRHPHTGDGLGSLL